MRALISSLIFITPKFRALRAPFFQPDHFKIGGSGPVVYPVLDLFCIRSCADTSFMYTTCSLKLFRAKNGNERHSCQPSRNGRDSPGLKPLVPLEQVSRNCPGILHLDS